MYNVNVVRQLCAEITAENDPQKAGELVSLLQAIFEENQEEIPVRMAFVADRKNGLMLHKTRFLLSGQFGYA